MGKRLEAFRKFSLEDKLETIGPPTLGGIIGTAGTYVASNAVKNPEIYQKISELQSNTAGTINLLPSTPEGTIIEMGFIGGFFVIGTVLTAYHNFKEKRAKYQKL